MFELDSDREHRSAGEADPGLLRHPQRTRGRQTGPSFAARRQPPWDPLSGEPTPWTGDVFDPIVGDNHHTMPALSGQSPILEAVPHISALHDGTEAPGWMDGPLEDEAEQAQGREEVGQTQAEHTAGPDTAEDKAQEAQAEEQNDAPPLPEREQRKRPDFPSEADDAPERPDREREQADDETDDQPYNRDQDRAEERPQEAEEGIGAEDASPGANAGQPETARTEADTGTQEGADASAEGELADALTTDADPQATDAAGGEEPQPLLPRGEEENSTPAPRAAPGPAEREEQMSGALPRAMRQMERAFGEDLSDVRVAPELPAEAASAGARAMAQGDTIAFDPASMDFDRPEGRKLLAHEVAHVLQRRKRFDSPRSQWPDEQGEARANAPPETDDSLREELEHEAEEAAAKAVRGAAARVGAAGHPGGGARAGRKVEPPRSLFFGLKGLWDKAKKGAAAALDKVKQVGSSARQALSGVSWKGLARSAVDVATDFVPGVSNVKDAITAIGGRNPVTGEKVGVLGRIAAGVFAIPGVGNVAKLVGKGGKLLGKGLFKAASKVPGLSKLLDKGGGLFKRFGGALLGKLKGLGKSVFDKLRSLGGSALSKLKSSGKGALDRLKGLGQSALDKLKSLTKGPLDRLKGLGQSALDKLKSLGSKVLSKLKGPLGKAATFVGERLGDLGKGLSKAKDLVGQLLSMGKAAFQNGWDQFAPAWMKKAASWAGGKLAGLASGARDLVVHTWDQFAPAWMKKAAEEVRRWGITGGYYPNAHGVGIGLTRDGKRIFGLDWHRFKQDGAWVNWPHYHRGATNSQLKKHRPWQGGW